MNVSATIRALLSSLILTTQVYWCCVAVAGNVNTQDPSWFAKIVDQGANCYFWESNTHYYPYINNETVTNQELLSQWLQDFALDKFKAYAAISKKEGLNIRISETNSM